MGGGGLYHDQRELITAMKYKRFETSYSCAFSSKEVARLLVVKHHNKMNSKQGKMKGAYILEGLKVNVLFGLQVNKPITATRL